MSLLGSIDSFFGSVEAGAKKVVGFVVTEMVNAENLLGGKTGNAKLNLVMSVLNTVLTSFGIDAKSAEAEVTTVINSLVALFNKVGLFTAASTK